MERASVRRPELNHHAFNIILPRIAGGMLVPTHHPSHQPLSDRKISAMILLKFSVWPFIKQHYLNNEIVFYTDLFASSASPTKSTQKVAHLFPDQTTKSTVLIDLYQNAEDNYQHRSTGPWGSQFLPSHRCCSHMAFLVR